MSETKLISPMLDNFAMGEPFSDHNGVRSCPAMDQHTGNKYIVKVISSPASSTQLDAMLLTGAFENKEQAVAYFKEMADSIADEAVVLKRLSDLEGFTAFNDYQVVTHDDGDGFDVYLLSEYRKSLSRKFRKDTMTHLSAVNLGLDMCSALSACRRAGYLYVNLKPDNIFIVGDSGYRIGDLGFIRLDSLKYASLPDRYRSAYTAPEIADAFASLNTTVDIYALGLVLYQAFNGGVLPTTATDSTLPPPDYADYEMAEIILKACALNPEDRWSDPAEMGQALVAYMQRNGVNDTPIVPVVIPVAPVSVTEPMTTTISQGDISNTDADTQPAAYEDAAEPEAAEDTDLEPQDVLPAEVHSFDAGIMDPTESEDPQSPTEEPVDSDAITPVTIEEMDLTDNGESQQESTYSEDHLGNLSFIAGDENDETLPGAVEEDLNYDQISVELSDILSQADELIAHPTPDPVVAPAPIEVAIPENTPVSEVEEIDTVSEEATSEQDSPQVEQLSYDPETSGIPVSQEPAPAEKKQKKRHLWIPFMVIGAALLMLLSLLAGGFYLYSNFFLQKIDSIAFDGDKTQLTVNIHSSVDESLLTVICSDIYGNQVQAPVVGSKAVFDSLLPATKYTISIDIAGFHHLTGNTTGTYVTPAQANISGFTALTGSQDGSAKLTFTSDRSDVTQWKVTYSTPGDEKKEVLFTGNELEIPGLTVGSVYDFELTSVEHLFVTGETKITHTASNIITAQDLTIKELDNSKLTVEWVAPTDATDINWIVRCTNNQSYDQEITTKENTATFTDITATDAFTVVVTAEGMSECQVMDIPADSVSIVDFKKASASTNKVVLSWTTTDTTKDKKLVLQYSADGSPVSELKELTGNSVELSPVVPGATYTVEIKTESGDTVIGGSMTFTATNAADFDDYGIKREHIKLTMCRTPSKANWKHNSVPKSDYTTTFAVGQKASFIIYLDDDKYAKSEDPITTLFVIRDADGKIVNIAKQTQSWKSMWFQHYGEFDIPALPAIAGNYVVTIYFNGAVAGVQNFTMTG